MAEFWYQLVTRSKRNCLAKLTLYVHICHVCDGLYASWRVYQTLRYRFKTLDRKPRPQSQSYIGPTAVGPDYLHTTCKHTHTHTTHTSLAPKCPKCSQDGKVAPGQPAAVVTPVWDVAMTSVWDKNTKLNSAKWEHNSSQIISNER